MRIYKTGAGIRHRYPAQVSGTGIRCRYPVQAARGWVPVSGAGRGGMGAGIRWKKLGWSLWREVVLEEIGMEFMAGSRAGR